jgi:signal peptidase I
VSRSLKLLVDIAQALVLTIVVYLLVQTFVAQPYRVEQGSMQDTLQEGQYVLVDKLTPRFDHYSRGDIVVFRSREDGDARGATRYIKRVIGVAGDEVEIHDGRVWVNGMALEESGYVHAGGSTYAVDQRQTHWMVPSDSLFVLGDHRVDSTDSRSARVGFVPVDHVIGRAFLRYWPISTVGFLETPSYAQVPVSGAGTP